MLNTINKLDVETLDRYSASGPIEVRYDLLESTPGCLDAGEAPPGVPYELRMRWSRGDVLKYGERAREKIRCGVLTECGGVA